MFKVVSESGCPRFIQKKKKNSEEFMGSVEALALTPPLGFCCLVNKGNLGVFIHLKYSHDAECEKVGI